MKRRRLEAWARAVFFDFVVIFGLTVPKMVWGVNSWILDIAGMAFIWVVDGQIILAAYKRRED